MKTNTDFESTLSHYRHRVDQTLKTAITAATTPTSLLREAMLYSTLNGGKRLRSTLVYAVGQALGQHPEQLDDIAAAIECIHSYSLIHDDLPAMDDDSLRRGKPTCHIAFGEATAILAGDALQTLAFTLLASPQKTTLSSQQQLKLIQVLATCAGGTGMVGGQSLDLLAEGKNISVTDLEQIHALKTGALIKASILMGAIGAGCEDQFTSQILEQFAEHIGLAFQLQDDLLDITGSRKKIGKNTQQDLKQHKATYAIMFGIEATQSRINALMASAMSDLALLNINTAFLKTFCEKLISRDN